MTARANELDAERHARITFLHWVRHHCRDKGIRSPDIWEAVNKETWLAEAAPANVRPRTSRSVHRLKRWWLKFEELLLPAGLRQRIWSRPSR
jgi:hypothetical protein